MINSIITLSLSQTQKIIKSEIEAKKEISFGATSGLRKAKKIKIRRGVSREGKNLGIKATERRGILQNAGRRGGEKKKSLILKMEGHVQCGELRKGKIKCRRGVEKKIRVHEQVAYPYCKKQVIFVGGLIAQI